MSVKALNFRVCAQHGHSLHRDARCLTCELEHPTPAAPKPAYARQKANALSSRRSERTSYVFNNRQRGTGS